MAPPGGGCSRPACEPPPAGTCVTLNGLAAISQMVELAHNFDDSAAYERFMGRWSRAAGEVFLDWMAPPTGARWLDVGCGTGIFTELIFDACSPEAVFAVDPAQAQIDHARRQPVAQRANFRVADAQALPFPDSIFDVVASALVINFIPDRVGTIPTATHCARGGLCRRLCVGFWGGARPTGLCAVGCANPAPMFRKCRASRIRAFARSVHCLSSRT